MRRLDAATWLGLLALAALLASSAPLFVCMPLTDDAAYHDLHAWNLLRGGIPYRDLLETNLPGAFWIQAAVRSLAGWSSEALRLFDLAAFSAVVALLLLVLRRAGRAPRRLAWTGVALFLFYFSLTEWCHAQRDLWMLLPAAAACHLRALQLARLRSGAAGVLPWAALEGAVWGLGVWIKPLVAIPAAAVWLAGAGRVRRPRALALDLGGLIAGGLAVGAAGVAWLVAAGSWPFFLETFREWNPRYVAAGREHWTPGRFAATAIRLFPWLLLHLPAAPLALGVLRRHSRPPVRRASPAADLETLLAALYLGWLLQSFLLQHLFDYVHVPAVLLAVTVLALAGAPRRRPRLALAAAAAFGAVALLVSPVLAPARLAAWPACLARGATPEVQNRLARIASPDWRDLERVAVFLEGRNLADRELTCLDNRLVHLYRRVGVLPSTRYVYLESLLAFFPDRRDEILAAVAASRQRYVVAELAALGISGRRLEEVLARGRPLAAALPAELRERFPWRYPLAFHSGSIVVLEVHPTANEPQP